VEKLLRLIDYGLFAEETYGLFAEETFADLGIKRKNRKTFFRKHFFHLIGRCLSKVY